MREREGLKTVIHFANREFKEKRPKSIKVFRVKGQTLLKRGILPNLLIKQKGPIEISVDGLSVGTYGFIIEVNDGYDGTVLDSVWVAVIPSSDSNFINLIYIDIIDQSFSTEDFNVTFAVYNESSQGIDTATIQMWWNGNDVSDSVINLGNGLYFVSLEPITVVPGEDPILLKMIISASGYEDKQFETYLAVDPDTLEKGVGNGVEGVPLVTIIIAIISTVAGIAVATATIVLLRKRKRASEGI